MNWDIPSSEAFLEVNLTNFVHFAAAGCGFYGSIEALVFSQIHPFMLAAKKANTNGDNPTWIQAINAPLADEYWEASGTEVNTL